LIPAFKRNILSFMKHYTFIDPSEFGMFKVVGFLVRLMCVHYYEYIRKVKIAKYKWKASVQSFYCKMVPFIRCYKVTVDSFVLCGFVE